MARPALEVADILRDHGPAWRETNSRHISLYQLKVMTAIERCRTADMSRAARTRRAAIRRSRTTPAATGIARSARPRRHTDGWPTAKRSCCRCRTFTSCTRLPSELRDIAYQNKRVVYDLLMKAAAETTLAIAPTGQARGLKAHDLKRLGARIGVTAVLHTWGSALTQNPHS